MPTSSEKKEKKRKKHNKILLCQNQKLKSFKARNHSVYQEKKKII